VSVSKYQLTPPNIPDKRRHRILLDVGVITFGDGGNSLKIQPVIFVDNITKRDSLTTNVICQTLNVWGRTKK